jgi:hypothetical protein
MKWVTRERPQVDPFDDRASFLAAARRVQGSVLVLYGADTPPRSRAEMEALADLPGIESRLLEHGTLGMAEELAVDLAPLIDRFLSRTGRTLLSTKST